ncbi:multiple epidermal growth factor-like domains protein 10 isoform X2 [Ruditapes philippinarum]|uniref:multiple epidermal growth factor-like domains protein 10 isoform X2 n=1 Tax=Ruditapes philippinarum TaxID=129788 RepID=UPI00295C2A5D|nr:multiple epidermal growth factor-like domains protein 10 isoform X2 [Ruditapes philippinarum]
MMSSTMIQAFLILACPFGISMQACPECVCCINGQHACDADRNCVNGCTTGYFGEKCTEECPENCNTCENYNRCKECKHGYYSTKCNIPCGKGCLNNTCSITGDCSCKSTDFVKGKCDMCSGDRYGDECNNTCASTCVSCTSETYCLICKDNAYYGQYCQYICPHGCNDGKCGKKNGHCSRGCKLKFTGHKCDTCSSGLYGTYCDLKCPGNCSVCTSESNCVQCNSGLFGEKCYRVCPSGCIGSCSFTDGRCFVCKPGLAGDFCNKTCENGTYGVNCSKSCRNIESNCQACSTDDSGSYKDCIKCDSRYYRVIPYGKNQSICTHCPYNCKGNVCNDNGVCTLGCLHGKWGERCTETCPKNCEKCSQSEGKCLECTRKTFSDDCLRNCSTNCNDTDESRVCTSDTGMCLQGCKSFTRYGEHCEKHCSDICNNGRCDWKTGHCLEGCKMNYFGLFCNDSCPHTCKSNENTRICDGVNGHCFYGCKDGFHGNRCGNRCSSQCQNTTCNQVTAECLHGCIEGYEGVKCSEDVDDGHSISTLLGATFAAGLVGVICGVTITLVLTLWRRRNGRQMKGESENIPVNTDGRLNDENAYESASPATYEELKSRDERLYSQLITSQQEMSQPAYDNVN